MESQVLAHQDPGVDTVQHVHVHVRECLHVDVPHTIHYLLYMHVHIHAPQTSLENLHVNS